MENTEIKQKLKEQLIGTGWDTKLRFFLLNDDLDNILDKLKMEVEQGNRFTPLIKEVLTPLIECHYDKVRVVFLCNQPSSSPRYNDGLALSIPNNGEPWGLSKKVYNAVKWDVNKGREPSTLELHRWAEQGVLLLNITLTTRIKSDSSRLHEEIWLPFTSAVINVLKKKEDVIYVLLGPAAGWEDSLDENAIRYVFPDIWKDQVKLNGSFLLEINKILRERGEAEITW